MMGKRCAERNHAAAMDMPLQAFPRRLGRAVAQKFADPAELGNKNDFFGEGGRDDKSQDRERDPLDFLKKSE